MHLGFKDSDSFFWLNVKVKINFVIVSHRLIVPKVEVEEFNGPWRESDVRYEFHVNFILKVLECR